MAERPRGTVAFFFTDLAESTRLWQTHPEAMQAAYARHDAILRDAIAAHRGSVYKVVGDALQAAFPTAPDAAAAAVQTQLALAAEDWRAAGLAEPLAVRLALHVGAVTPDADGDYRSPVLNRCGRLLAAAHGGQVLLSQAAVTALDGTLPPGITMRDLGEHHLRDLPPEHVWQLLHPALHLEFPPLAAPRPENLPRPPTALIGRERELADLLALLRRDEVRLVTLLGPGGIGKTRLGLATASAALPWFGEGVYFVSLAALVDPELVPDAIAASLGVPEAANRSLWESLRVHLRHRHLLLLLDNMEQVIAVAPMVAELLAACPRLAVLTTSRTPLHLRGERLFPVPPLGLPPAAEVTGHLTPERARGFAAVRLFAARAEDVSPGFALTGETAPAVTELCRRLDGLPLAIELAAPRIRLFPPAVLLARLERRLPELTSGPRDLPDRQQTLRATIAWSYDLLSDEDRTRFRRLAVFAGGCSLEAAGAVTHLDGDGDPAAGLAALRDHSLLRQELEPSDDPRFTMLETIREFALEQLEVQGEAEAARGRHAAFFLARAAASSAVLRGSEPGPAYEPLLAQFDTDHDNLRAALTYFFEREDAKRALRLAAAMWFFWDRRGHLTEGRRWLDRALAGDQRASAARAEALLGAGALAYHANDFDRATGLLQASIVLNQRLGNAAGVASALAFIAVCAAEVDHERAIALLEEVLAAQRQLGNRAGTVAGLANLASALMQIEELERAAALLEEAFTLADAHGEALGAAHVLLNLSELALRRGERARAVALGQDTLARWWRLKDQWGIVACLNVLGRGLAAERPAAAARLLGMEEALREASGISLPPTYHDLLRRAAGTIRAALGEQAFAAAWAAGRALPLDQAVTEALALEAPDA